MLLKVRREQVESCTHPIFQWLEKQELLKKIIGIKVSLIIFSSFAGFFPADKPKYSCIVVIHEPDKGLGYYGADVSGPVFKSIAQKIYTNSPLIDTVDELNNTSEGVDDSYKAYYTKVQRIYNEVPNVKGMSGMDAVPLLENLGLRVRVVGNGKVREQSLSAGQKIQRNQTIILQLS